MSNEKALATILALVMAIGLCSVSWATDPAVAKVGNQEYATLAEAITAAQAGDTIVLTANITLTSTLNLAKNVTIDGQGAYTIKAADNFSSGNSNSTACVLYVSATVTLKNVTVDGNGKCRVIFCDKGKLTIDGATITNGKAPNFIGGVYMTSSASFEMNSGSIVGNKTLKIIRTTIITVQFRSVDRCQCHRCTDCDQRRYHRQCVCEFQCVFCQQPR